MRLFLTLATTALLCLAGCGNVPGAACDKDSDCPAGRRCANNLCVEAPPVSGTEPTCTPPGVLGCPAGDFFTASAASSGCFPNGTMVPGRVDPPYDNPDHTCPAGTIVIACEASTNCSACFPKSDALPPGCTKQ